MSPRYDAKPGLDPQLETEATEETWNRDAQQWAQNPDRWMLLGQDPVGETTLEDALVTWWPQAMQAPAIRQAQLDERQKRLLARAWMVGLTDRPVQTPKPGSAPSRVQPYLEGLIRQVRTVS